jgi:hypothetical protein
MRTHSSPASRPRSRRKTVAFSKPLVPDQQTGERRQSIFPHRAAPCRSLRSRPPVASETIANDLSRSTRPGGSVNPTCGALSMLRRSDDHRRDVPKPAPYALPSAEPHQDRHLMIDVALLAAPQCRSPSPPAARRSTNSMPSQGHQSSSDRHPCAKPAHSRNRKRSPSPVPPARLRAIRRHLDPRAPSAILKSP